MLLSKIIKILEDWCPTSDAEDFDNVGLLVGDQKSEINKAIITLDITDDVIDECIYSKTNLIISFHPLFTIDPKTDIIDKRVNDLIIKCLNNNINVYCIHTNLDNNKNGTSYQLGKILELKNQKILLSNDDDGLKGMGSIGFMDKPMNDYNFLNFLKEKFKLNYLRHSNLLNKKIEKVALVAGSGSFAIENAISEKADCLISSDYKYHDFFKANDKITLIDIGHYESEKYTKELIFEFLNKKLTNIALHLSDENTNPIKYY